VHLRAFAAKSASELNIFRLDGDALSMNGTEVGVLKERDEVSLDRFLESTNSTALETKVGLEILSDFTNETLEWQLSDQKLSGLLVATNLTEGDSSGLVSVGLLDTTGRWS